MIPCDIDLIYVPRNAEDLKKYQKSCLQQGMFNAYLISLPARGLSTLIEKICDSTAITKFSCEVVEMVISKAIEPIVTQELVASLYEKVTKEIKKARTDLSESFLKEYGIPKEETQSFFDSMSHNLSYLGMWGGGKVGQLFGKILSKARPIPTYFADKALEKLGMDPRYFATSWKSHGNEISLGFYYYRSSLDKMHTKVMWIGEIGGGIGWKPNLAKSMSSASLIAAKIIKDLAQKNNVSSVTISFWARNEKISQVFAKLYKEIKCPPRITKFPGEVSHHFEIKVSPRISGVPNFFGLVGTTGMGFNRLHPLAIKEGEIFSTQSNQFKGWSWDQTEGLVKSEFLQEYKPQILMQEKLQDLTAPFANPIQAPIDPNLSLFIDQLVHYAESMTGIKPVIEEIEKIRRIIGALALDPRRSPMVIVSELLAVPIDKIQILLKAPEKLISSGTTFLQGTTCLTSSVTGALYVVGIVLAVMESVIWLDEFGKDPKKQILGLFTAPVDCVKDVYHLMRSLIKDPIKTSTAFFKAIVRAPGRTIKRFFRILGIGRKKKRKKILSPYLQDQITAKYVEDLRFLFLKGRDQWYIDPFKTIKEYHQAICIDWESAKNRQMYHGALSSFPQFLIENLHKGGFEAVYNLSPLAHLKEPLAPPEVALEIEKLVFGGFVLKHVFQQLDKSIQKETQLVTKQIIVMKELGTTLDSLHEVTNGLHNLITGNEEKIKEALRRKLLEKKKNLLNK